LVFGSIACAFVVACSSSDSEIGSEPKSPYEQYIDDLVDLLCGSGAQCCSDPAYSESTCRTWLPLLAERPDPENFVFHEDIAEQCLAATRANTACGDEPEVCGSVVTGLVAPGGACRTNLECTPLSPLVHGVCDEQDDGSSHCRQAVKLGESCDATCVGGECVYSGALTRTCNEEDGLVCGLSDTCEALVPVGASCRDKSCAMNAHCDDNLVCAPDVGPGATCRWTECMEGTYCKASVCTPELPAGATCDPSVDFCADGGWCENGICARSTFVCALFRRE
jgi:hypothetical protein